MTISNEKHTMTFCNSRGNQSAIDWTIVTSELAEKIQNWHIPHNQISLSDHFFVLYTIEDEPKSYNPTKKMFHKVNWDFFRSTLKTEIANIDTQQTSHPSIENQIQKIILSLSNTIDKIVPQSISPKYKNKWWNSAVQKMKTAVRQAKRSGIDHDYIQKKAEFEKEILQAKQKSWQQFMTSVESKDEAYIRHKIVCKRREKVTIPSLQLDGQFTSSAKDAASILIDTNFPDLPRPLTQDHKLIEDQVQMHFK